MILENTYVKVSSIEEAIKCAKANEGNFKFIAGGTDLMVNKFQGNIEPKSLIDLTGIEDMKKVSSDGSNVYIGALMRLDDLKKQDLINTHFPTLITAAAAVGSPLIRKTATIGGNVLCENRCLYYNQSEWWREAVGYCLKCNGDICIATGGRNACFSEFVSDTVPALIAYNAKIKLTDSEGTRIVDIQDIYSGDGVNSKTITSTTILQEIILPLNKSYTSVFKKLRQRESLEFTALTTCVSLDQDKNIIIALAGIDPKPVVVRGTSSDDLEGLIKQAFKGARAIDNDMFSRVYRKEMLTVYLNESFKELKMI